MQPHDFLTKWRNPGLTESAASQSHFNDLCALLGVLPPVAADPAGEWFAFEKGASKTGGGAGRADVWRRGCFAWEYKGPGRNLDAALAQLLQYSAALESPPLLIVSDMDRIRVHTNWTNTVQEVHEFTTEGLLDGDARERLKRVFVDPGNYRPAKTRAMLTEETAREFAGLAQRLRDRGHDSYAVAHFVNRLAFCMFAEDSALLPDRIFTKMLTASTRAPERFPGNARKLFAAMRDGGDLDFTPIDWFNGGLFDDDAALPLTGDDLRDLLKAAKRDWSDIDPAILGTLFERGLDPAKRSQLGAHYTDRAKIMLIVRPVIIDPLTAEWADALARMTALVETAREAVEESLSKASSHVDLNAEVEALRGILANGDQGELFADLQKQRRVSALDPIRAAMRAASRRLTDARAGAEAIHSAFIERLAAFRVLDPACGSGNFLYVALRALKDIEHRANLDAEALGCPRGFPRAGPECVLGIELNPYAAELARVSVWIGEIQWMRRNGFDAARNPILRPLKTIECRDAVLNEDGTRAEWPAADVVVGNPPFLGASRMNGDLGESYTHDLREAWAGVVPGFGDLVAFWFAKAWQMMTTGHLVRAGLVATNSIRGGANREVLKPIAERECIAEAWSDEEWTVEGADVRVSIVCFAAEKQQSAMLDGQAVGTILANLTSNALGFDLTHARKLAANFRVAFEGPKKYGHFEMDGNTAREILMKGGNPHGEPNSRVIRPWLNGRSFSQDNEDMWIADFTAFQSLAEACLFEAPFAFVEEKVRPERQRDKTATLRDRWWLFERPRPMLRSMLAGKSRYIGTVRHSKHRLYRFLPVVVLPDTALIAIARDDDTSFGILHSRFHELWSLRMGTFLGVGNDPRYTPSTTFETFPFPDGLTPDIPAAAYADDPRAQAIAAAAARLNDLRENWLNPADLTMRVPEVVPGYPDRILPRDPAAAKELKQRTLTSLYNARPQWLANAHAALDGAVADAYGWGADWQAGALNDDEILARLFRLNQAR